MNREAHLQSHPNIQYVWVPLCLVQFAKSIIIQYSSIEISPTFLIFVSGSVKEVILKLYFVLNLWNC